MADSNFLAKDEWKDSYHSGSIQECLSSELVLECSGPKEHSPTSECLPCPGEWPLEQVSHHAPLFHFPQAKETFLL